MTSSTPNFNRPPSASRASVAAAITIDTRPLAWAYKLVYEELSVLRFRRNTILIDTIPAACITGPFRTVFLLIWYAANDAGHPDEHPEKSNEDLHGFGKFLLQDISIGQTVYSSR